MSARKMMHIISYSCIIGLTMIILWTSGNKSDIISAMEKCYFAQETIEFQFNSTGKVLCKSKNADNIWYSVND